MRPAFKSALARSLALAATLAAASASASAQSSDVGRPTPIFTGEVAARVAPRDVGDARLTRHFYAFTGREGDLFVTVESAGLNGDFDLFTAGGLRPLLKITVLPTSSGYFVKKSVYLRRDEPLILRVEGRALGESAARYRVRLEGAFGPATGAFAENPPLESYESAADESAGDRRVTSAGARIPRPVVEPTPAPEAPAEAARAEPTPEDSRPAAEPTPASPRRGARGARGAGRTTARNRPAPAREPAAQPEAERETGEAEAAPPRTTRTGPPRRTTGRGGRSRPPAREGVAGERAETAGPPAAEEAPGARLIIVTRDGETIERDMRSVRRVTVERGQIVVVGTDGSVSRMAMTNVVRMAIEP